jgi:hypothetical protein
VPSLTPGDKFFNPPLEVGTFQQNVVLAFEAPDADVGAHPVHLPLVTAAGVLFFKADDVTRAYLHAGCL